MNNKSVLVAAALALLTGCDLEELDGGSSSSREITPENLPIIEGVWQQTCTQDTEQGYYYDGLAIYGDDRVSIFGTYYTDSQCQNTLSRIKLEGSYGIGESFVLSSGVRVNTLSQNMDSAQVAFYEHEHITQLNQNSVCDTSTWSRGLLQEALNCEALDLNIASMNEDIVQIAGKQMRSGDFSTLNSAGYPATLDAAIWHYQAPTRLEGEWQQPCTAKPSRFPSTETLIITGQTIVRSTKLFSDSSCEHMLLDSSSTWLIELGDTVILVSGETVNTADMKPLGHEVALHDASLVSMFNDYPSTDCGGSTWQEGVYKDALNCGPLGNIANNIHKEIIKIDDAEITWGDIDTGRGIDGYPTQLQPVSHLRQ